MLVTREPSGHRRSVRREPPCTSAIFKSAYDCLTETANAIPMDWHEKPVKPVGQPVSYSSEIISDGWNAEPRGLEPRQTERLGP
jgi:hypothetical protein